MILILPAAFLTIFYYSNLRQNNWVEALVRAELIFHALLLLITNVWSIPGILNRYTVLISWAVVVFITVFLGAKIYGLQPLFSERFGKSCKEKLWRQRKLSERILLVLMLALLLVLLVGAIFTVPYNYDSMTYHLGRLAHWVDNGSVNHFVTSIDRQLYSPVLAEYDLLHMFLLSGNDTFLNFLQYFAMIVTAVILYRTARKLNVSVTFSLFGAFLYLTMPLTISQSITTQNDLFAAMWFAVFLYYLVDFIQVPKITCDREQFEKFILTGASVAFAFLTKTSICASMLFFMPWLLVVCLKRKDKLSSLLLAAVTAGGTLVVLISETLIRTYLSCGKLMADTTSANIMVATSNVKYILVNITKNFSLLITQHLFRPLNGFIYRLSIGLGSLLKVDFNNEAIAYHGFDFLHHMNMGEDMYSHDKTPSAFVTYLALFVGVALIVGLICMLIAMIRNRRQANNAVSQKIHWFSRIHYGLLISSWLSLGFIMALLRWQPWGTRLMYPALAMMVLTIVNVLDCLCGPILEKKMVNVVLIPLITLGTVLAIAPIAYNMQPAMESIEAGCSDRMKRYFRFNDRYTAYEQLIEKTEELGAEDIGLSISGDGYDYPLWLMYRKADEKVKLHHVLLDSDETPLLDDQSDVPECILYVERGRLELGEIVTYHGMDYSCVYISDANPDAPDAVLVRVDEVD